MIGKFKDWEEAARWLLDQRLKTSLRVLDFFAALDAGRFDDAEALRTQLMALAQADARACDKWLQKREAKKVLA